mmetsp:Transcript_7878/g.17162  ORF Transcript_7878/g.17162 Transcript_7878/m.17162 type:complete len:89 (+) Transcript_7878:114-380(+)
MSVWGSVWDEPESGRVQVAEFQVEENKQLHDRVRRRDTLLQVREDEINELISRVARRDLQVQELQARTEEQDLVLRFKDINSKRLSDF